MIRQTKTLKTIFLVGIIFLLIFFSNLSNITDQRTESGNQTNDSQFNDDFTNSLKTSDLNVDDYIVGKGFEEGVYGYHIVSRDDIRLAFGSDFKIVMPSSKRSIIILKF